LFLTLSWTHFINSSFSPKNAQTFMFIAYTSSYPCSNNWWPVPTSNMDLECPEKFMSVIHFASIFGVEFWPPQYRSPVHSALCHLFSLWAYELLDWFQTVCKPCVNAINARILKSTFSFFHFNLLRFHECFFISFFRRSFFFGVGLIIT